MINVNLLPDSKQRRLRAKKLRQTVLSISVIVTIASLGLTATLFIVALGMNARISSVSEQIDEKAADYQDNPELERQLTVQNQLNSLLSVEEQRVFGENLLEVLEYATPKGVEVNTVEYNTESGGYEIEADARTIAEINSFIETLKALKYAEVEYIEGEDEPLKSVFDTVNEATTEQFSIDNDEDDGAVFSVEVSGLLNTAIFSLEDIEQIELVSDNLAINKDNGNGSVLKKKKRPASSQPTPVTDESNSEEGEEQ